MLDDPSCTPDMRFPDSGYLLSSQRILDEDVKKRKYKVDWEGVNPDTGRSWSPTWVRADGIVIAVVYI